VLVNHVVDFDPAIICLAGFLHNYAIRGIVKKQRLNSIFKNRRRSKYSTKTFFFSLWIKLLKLNHYVFVFITYP